MSIKMLDYDDICKVFSKMFTDATKPVLFKCKDKKSRWYEEIDQDHIILILQHNFRGGTAILSDNDIVFDGYFKKLNNNKEITEKYQEALNYIFSEEYAKKKYLKSIDINIDKDLAM